MNINQRQIKKMMSQMGMNQEEVDAEYVIIKTKEHKIVINDPQVMKVVAMGQESYQVTGEEEIVEDDDENDIQEISSDDIETVMEQTDCSQDDALYALQESNGDIAEAILKLTEEEE